MKTVPLALAVFLLSAPLAAQQPGLEEAVATITQDDYAWRVGVIAHDSMQGRDTPSPGLDMTAEWIASEFRRMGLQGGAEDGGFIQRYPLRSIVADFDASSVTIAGQSLDFGEQVIPLYGASQSTSGTGGVALIVGSQNLAGAVAGGAVEGAHVVLIPGANAATGRRGVFGMIAQIRDAGAASLSVATTVPDEAWAVAAARAQRPAVQKGWVEQAASATMPSLQIRTQALADALARHGVDVNRLEATASGDAELHIVDGVSASISLSVRDQMISAPNVVGILEGSDPVLKDEYVVFSGHMDHVGIGTPDATGDSIYNGADDDASGTIAVVEVAEAMASLPVAPRRSMIFLLVSGEEKGLWGSEYYAENPTRPVESLVANFNTDMVGRNWPDTIVAIGKEHSDLGETMNRVNGAHPELRMTAIDDIWPEQSFYTRSDHYNFARKGVPVLFFFNGTHEDYHRPSDEPDKIDSEKAARIARLVFYLGVEVANAAERPKWNPESYARIVSDR